MQGKAFCLAHSKQLSQEVADAALSVGLGQSFVTGRIKGIQRDFFEGVTTIGSEAKSVLQAGKGH